MTTTADMQVGAGSPVAIEKVFVVLNPVAGLTNAENARQTIERFCQEKGWDCNIHETKPDEDLRDLVRQELKKGVDLVIAAGGDGTVSAVVSGMVNSNKPMGILPAGTGNAVARDLSIPLDIQQALDLLGGDHTIRKLDAMELNGDYWVLNVSVGVSSLTMRNTSREQKRRFGMLAYAWRAAGLLRRSDTHRFELRMNDRIYRFHASEVMIANSKLLGLQPNLEGVEIDMNDGRLDLFIVRAEGTRDYLGLFAGFLFPKDRNADEKLRYLEITDTIEISSEFPLPVQADGEVVGNTPIRVKLVPDALQVVVPAVKA